MRDCKRRVSITTIETESWGERFFQVTDPNGVVLQLVQWMTEPLANEPLDIIDFIKLDKCSMCSVVPPRFVGDSFAGTGRES